MAIFLVGFDGQSRPTKYPGFFVRNRWRFSTAPIVRKGLWAMKVYKSSLMLSDLPISIMLSHLISCCISNSCQQMITISLRIRGRRLNHRRLSLSVSYKTCKWQTEQNQKRLKSCPASRSTTKMLWETLLKQQGSSFTPQKPPCSKGSKSTMYKVGASTRIANKPEKKQCLNGFEYLLRRTHETEQHS